MKKRRTLVLKKRLKNKNPLKAVRHLNARKVMDNKRSIANNYDLVGLQFNPNKPLNNRKRNLIGKADEVVEEKAEEPLDLYKDTSEEESEEEQKVDLKEVFTELPTKEQADKVIQRPKKLTHDEKAILKSLIKKYGNDFDKMKKDIKINYFQWNKGQLRNRYELYQYWTSQNS